MRFVRTLRLIVALSAWSVAGCGRSDITAPNPVTPKPAVPPPPGAPVATYMVRLAPTVVIVPAEGTVPLPPAVVVRDQFGVPMANVLVTFTDSDLGNGSVITNPTVRTDTNGVATCGRWIVGSSVGLDAVFASTRGVRALEFDALVVLPDPPGERYDLVTRDGRPPSPGEVGWLVLSADSTFRLVGVWGLGYSGAYVTVDSGRYVRRDSALTFADQTGYAWSAVLQGPILTVSYDDSLDCGFPCTVVDVYMWLQPQSSRRALRASTAKEVR